jgi:hypothetical protein
MAALAGIIRGKPAETGGSLSRSDPFTDLGLTLPIFLGYHLAVVFLPVRNAADFLTRELQSLAANDILAYGGLTLAIGAVFIGVLLILGRGKELRAQRFLWLAAEGIAYAVAMRLIAGWVIGELRLVPGEAVDRYTGLVMSLGAGFYEELAFRVILFGLGAKLLTWIFVKQKMDLTGTAPAKSFSFHALLVMIGWSVVCAFVFSGVHYIGPMSDSFQLASFTFRFVLGLALTLIYATRGFAAAVWTHALYDVWVLVL